MRRLCAFFMLALVFTCFVNFSKAENIEGMSFSEIQETLDTYNLKLWEAGNWSSIVVPAGLYTVGIDIPAGTYKVTTAYSNSNSSVNLWPAEDEQFDYRSDNPRFIDETVGTKPYELTLLDGDRLYLLFTGLSFSIDSYTPRFTVNQEQEDEVQRLKDEYKSLEEELRRRPEWQEVKVPEGTYEVCPKIPVGHWSVWPAKEFGITGVHYGAFLYSDGTVAATVNAALKNSKLPTFKYGFQQDRCNIEAEEGSFISVTDTVIFTPYAGKTLFLFNE